MDRKKRIAHLLLNVLLLVAGFIMHWGGLFHAIKDTTNFKIVGIVISIIGCGFILLSILRYEKNA